MPFGLESNGASRGVNFTAAHESAGGFGLSAKRVVVVVAEGMGDGRRVGKGGGGGCG